MSDHHEIHDEQTLLRAIGAVLDDGEPLPDHLSQYARTVFELGGLDAELAELSYDSLSDEAVALRDEGDEATASRTLTWSSDTLSIEIEIRPGGELSVQLLPAVPAVLRVQTPFGETERVAADAGSFRAVAPAIEFRLVVETEDGEVKTDWIPPPTAG